MKTKHIYKNVIISIVMLAIYSSAYSKSPSPAIKEEPITYTADGVTMKGFVAYDQNIKGKRPVVLIVHEWWGLNDYPKMRARMLAELGYFAVAVDLFGNGKVAADPTEAQSLTKPFYTNPALAKNRMDAAIAKVKGFTQADAGNIAAIGYCFGGAVVLNYANLGADLKGVVSFHGGLSSVQVKKNKLKAKILICHGASDKFVPMHDAEVFTHKLDSIGADYTFKVYANATHSFTNPDATSLGKKFNIPIEYNAEADKDSWNDMKAFLNRIFGKG